MSKHRKRKLDYFSKRAKQDGLVARSAYKLQEIDERWRIIQPDTVVVDLGCAPGSWLQYVIGRTGSRGQVWGFDIKAVSMSFPSFVQVVQKDIFEISTCDLPPTVDVLLSDMAPSTMGNHQTDAIRSAVLAEQALTIGGWCLKPGSSCVIKVLEGRDVPDLITDMRKQYKKVNCFRPAATRKHSTEIFLVGQNFLG